MNESRRSMVGIAAALVAGSALKPLGAWAQGAYPTKAIRIIVPYPAGGVVDSIARVVGERMGRQYGQPVVVENRTGAGGAIGTDFVAKSPADGYTLLMVSPSHAVMPFFQKNTAWDPVRDFKGIAGFGAIPNVIVVHPSVKAKTMQEFLRLARKDAGSITYASSGLGTSSHLTGELLNQMAHIQLTHVPYKGQPEAMTDLLSGRVDMMPMSTSLALPHIKAGKLRALAVTTDYRSSALPDVPTVAEAAGLPGFQVGTWLALLAPAKVPPAIVSKLSADVASAIKLAEVQSKFKDLALEGAPQSGAAFDEFLKQEVSVWTEVIKRAGIQANS